MLYDKLASPHCKEALLISQSPPSPPVVPASLALAQELSQAMLRMDMALEREYAFDIFSNLMVSTGSAGPHPTWPLATSGLDANGIVHPEYSLLGKQVKAGEPACCIPCRNPIKASRMALYPLEWRKMLPAVLVTVRQRLAPLAWPRFQDSSEAS